MLAGSLLYVYALGAVESCAWGGRDELEGVGDGVLALRLSGGGECYADDSCSIASDDVLLPFLAAVVGLELDVGSTLSVDDEGGLAIND